MDLRNGSQVKLNAEAAEFCPLLANHVLVVIDENHRPHQPLVAPLLASGGPDFAMARMFFRDDFAALGEVL